MNLGPSFEFEGAQVREVLNDFSHLDEDNRPPKYLIAVEDKVKALHWSQDKSDNRAPVELMFPGKPISELKGKHSGKVAILFNGWSLAGKDLHRIKAEGIPIIGMNRTFVGFKSYDGPQPDYLCIVDHVWFTNEKCLSHPFLINGSTDKGNHGYRVARSMRMSPFSFDLARDGYVNPVPATTGFLALQLAAYLGFTDIFCLGLDLCGQHFDHTTGSLHFSMARAHMDRMAPVMAAAGLKTYVVGSPDSRAPFQKVEFEALFA
jgi:hypothetical protein